MNSQEVEQFTLLVAGSRAGKSSFLRLVLDTSDISQANSKDQLASVAKFVHASAAPTTHIRSTSIDIDTDNGHSLALNLIDTPTIDFADDAAAEHIVSETIRLIDSRFMEGLDDERKAHSGDRFVHLCIYFLDPDLIVPPSAPRPPAPLLSRTRTNSFTEQEPVILEPPVTTNPLMFRPTLPAADIATIRRLSARVNVLPVISRADILSNDRLAAVKLAVRRDLADAGIGFGIFDMDNQSHNQPSGQSSEDSKLSVSADPMANNGSNGYAGSGVHLNGGSNSSASTTTSPPTSPVSPSIMRLPYALVSPDSYSHSEGVPRVPPPRHELVQQYTPSPSGSRNARRGKFLRCYRWGTLDVLDPSHSDFVPLRNAIFHHMETLQKYTRDYLFEKYRSDYIQMQQQRPPSRQSHLPHTHTRSHSHSHPHPIHPMALLTHQHSHSHMGGSLGPHTSRPILAINTHSPNQHTTAPPELRHAQPLPSMGRHPPPHSVPVQLASSRDLVSGNGADGRTPGSSTSARAGGLTSSGVVASGDSPGASASASGRAGSGRPLTTSNRTRSKKITVACNFCRSRKLKCDGGRPACGQCLKRSNPCDYAPQNKRRNTIRQARRPDMGGSSRPGDEDDDSGDYNRGESGNEDGRSEVSMSPEVSTIPLSATGSVSAPISRRGSNVDKRERDGGYVTHHSLPPILDRERERNELGQSARPPPPPPQQHPGHTLHHITERDHHLHMRDREREAIGPLSNVAPPPSSIPTHGRGLSRPMFPDNDLPHITTLSLPERSSPSTPGPMSAPTLPLLRPASEQQAAIRKRAATVPGKSGSGGRGSGSGPKVVACNSCRARKTKCDGAHPACASCSRRHVPCLYAHDTNGNSGAGRDPNGSTGTKKRRASASVHQGQQQPQQQQRQHHLLTRQGGYAGNEEGRSSGSLSPPSSRMLQTPSTAGPGPGNNEMMIDRHPPPHSHHLYAVYRDPGSSGRAIDHHGSEGGADDRDRDERLSVSERDRLSERDREIEMDLKRPLPLEHLDRGDLERRGVPHDHDELEMEMRTTKKMRMEDGRPIP